MGEENRTVSKERSEPEMGGNGQAAVHQSHICAARVIYD